VIKYLGSSGGITWRALRLDPLSRMTLFPGATAAPEEAPALSDQDFATIVEADGLLAVERTMFWDASGYGSHAEAGIPGPSTTWHFAEGATHGRFDLFYLLQNPGDLPANVSIRFLRTNRQPPIERVYSVGANMRRTIWVDIEDPRLEAADVAARIVSDVPIVAERAMYLSVEGQPFAAGSGGAGVTTPATRWFLAEGATGAFFDMFVLIANPTPEPATLLVTYLLESATVRKTYSVAAQGRLTISVDGEDPRLANAAMSVIVESTNDVPVVVERAMWWPEGRWYEGHAVAATTTSATRWALPRVFSGPSDSPQTYVLVANPTTSAVALTLTAAIPGEAPVTSRLTIPPQSRTTLLGSTLLPRSTITVYALIVESDGPPIVVERSEYWNGGGVIWGAGTAAAATPIP
jgi:hypothetical protein